MRISRQANHRHMYMRNEEPGVWAAAYLVAIDLRCQPVTAKCDTQYI
jgi:hypothetical protein